MRSLFSEISRFIGVGGLASLVHYSALIALVEMGDVSATLAALIGFFLGGVLSYQLNYRWTFRSNKEHAHSLPRFILIAAIGFILTGFLMYVLTQMALLPYLLAQILTTALVLVWHYIGNKFWTFRTDVP